MKMEPPFDPAELRKVLSTLPGPRRLAFAVACSERLFPNYVAFAREQDWGDPNTVRAALDLAWEVVLDSSAARIGPGLLRKKVEDVTPDTSDFTSTLVSPALDAAATASLVLKMLEVEDVNIPVEVASLNRDTVDMYIQFSEGLDPMDGSLEQEILHHPLMQAELRRQRSDLHILATASWTPEEARRLKDAWREPEVSNIGTLRPR